MTCQRLRTGRGQQLGAVGTGSAPFITDNRGVRRAEGLSSLVPARGVAMAHTRWCMMDLLAAMPSTTPATSGDLRM